MHNLEIDSNGVVGILLSFFNRFANPDFEEKEVADTTKRNKAPHAEK